MRSELESDPERLRAAEETLRMVAQISPPEGITDRVHRRLRENLDQYPARGVWRLWLPVHRLQFAGAALLVITIAASTLMVRHPQTNAPAMHPVPQVPQQGTGLGIAGAQRHPASLTPILVPPTAKKKPGPAHVAKHTAKPLSSPSVSVNQGSGNVAPVQAQTKP